MPSLRKSERALSVHISDLHLSHLPPPLRRGEPNWYEAMARPLAQIRELCRLHDCLAVYQGDIFDTWRPCPELINFALTHLPKGYAVPGNHDLPYHVYEDRYKSGYGVLCSAGVLFDLPVGNYVQTGDELALWGFPHGTPLHPIAIRHDGNTHVAVCHEYVWYENFAFRGAPLENHLSKFANRTEGFAACFFGDNHQYFSCSIIHNVGTMMIRRSDEVKLEPSVCLLFPGGKVKRVKLDTSKDHYSETKDIKASELNDKDIESLVAELKKPTVDGDSLDFVHAVVEAMQTGGVTPQVRKMVLEAIGKGEV